MNERYYLRETGAQVQQAITDVREKTIYDNVSVLNRGLMSAEDKRKLDGLDTNSSLSILEINELLNF